MKKKKTEKKCEKAYIRRLKKKTLKARKKRERRTNTVDNTTRKKKTEKVSLDHPLFFYAETNK